VALIQPPWDALEELADLGAAVVERHDLEVGMR
jgi:hypothetical protein